MVMQHIAANPNLGYAIVGFLHDLSEPPGDFGRFKMLGTIDDIGPVIRSMQIDEVIIALPAHMHQQVIRSLKLCERLGTSFNLIPDLYELSLSRIDMDTIEGIPTARHQTGLSQYLARLDHTTDRYNSIGYHPDHRLPTVVFPCTGNSSQFIGARHLQTDAHWTERQSVPDIQVSLNVQRCRSASSISTLPKRGQRSFIQNKK